MNHICGLLSLTYYNKETEISKAKENLKSIGYEFCEDFAVRKKFLNKWDGSPFDRLKKFYESWNSENETIFIIRGGSGIDHIIPLIEFDSLEKNKKSYVGHSDATPLLNYIYQSKGNICFHGPMPISKIEREDKTFLKKALKRNKYEVGFKEQIKSKKAYGKSVGGNLSRLVEYTSKKIIWNFDKKILFLEESSEVSGYRFLNLVLALKNNNRFNPSAIVLGNLNSEYEDYIKNSMKELLPDIPIISGISFGHTSPNITIPIGANCTIDFKRRKIIFEFS